MARHPLISISLITLAIYCFQRIESHFAHHGQFFLTLRCPKYVLWYRNQSSMYLWTNWTKQHIITSRIPKTAYSEICFFKYHTCHFHWHQVPLDFHGIFYGTLESTNQISTLNSVEASHVWFDNCQHLSCIESGEAWGSMEFHVIFHGIPRKSSAPHYISPCSIDISFPVTCKESFMELGELVIILVTWNSLELGDC